MTSAQALQRAAWIALAFAFLRTFLAAHLDLAPDEAYYWEWSRSLDWAYYEQGPMLALAIRAGTWLAGNNEVGVRLASLLLGPAVTLMGAYIVAVPLQRPKLAVWLSWAFNSVLLFQVGALLIMHDSLMAFWWMLALLALVQASRTSAAWLALAGLGIAGAMLSKHSGLALGLSSLTAIALLPSLRRHAMSTWAWFAYVVAIAGGLPIVYWNQKHHWASLTQTLHLGGRDASRVDLRSFPEFVGGQAGLISPLLFGLAVWGWWKTLKAWRKGQASEVEKILWLGSAPFFLLFAVLALRSRVEANWPGAAFLGGIMLGGIWLERSGGLNSHFSRWALGIALSMSLLAQAQAVKAFMPFSQNYAKADSVSRVDGWKELGARVEAERREMLARGSVAVFTGARTFQNAGELAFYQTGQARTLYVTDQIILNQYRYWNDPAAHAGEDVVLVVGQDWELGEMATHFKRHQVMADEVFVRNGIEVRRSRIVRAWGFNPLRVTAAER